MSSQRKFPNPDDPAHWSTVLSREALAEILATLGDSATAYWTTLSADNLRREMQSTRQNNWPLRYMIARSALAARDLATGLPLPSTSTARSGDAPEIPPAPDG